MPSSSTSKTRVAPAGVCVCRRERGRQAGRQSRSDLSHPSPSGICAQATARPGPETMEGDVAYLRGSWLLPLGLRSPANDQSAGESGDHPLDHELAHVWDKKRVPMHRTTEAGSPYQVGWDGQLALLAHAHARQTLKVRRDERSKASASRRRGVSSGCSTSLLCPLLRCRMDVGSDRSVG